MFEGLPTVYLLTMQVDTPPVAPVPLSVKEEAVATAAAAAAIGDCDAGKGCASVRWREKRPFVFRRQRR